MAKTRKQKTQSLEDIAARMKLAKGVVFMNFQGLKTKESNELRGSCDAAGLKFTVTKKTILRKSLSELGLTLDTKSFAGGVSVVTGQGDEVVPAQLVAAFKKKHEVVKVFGGLLEGKLIDAAMVLELAKLPGKQQLLGQLVGTLNAPVSGFVNVLAGNLRGLITVLQAVKDKKPA
ncbi:MAG: 50S ribosomal protein L10 [Candidatus Magasanikbacteria bacterium]|nr:50S ribosomal protein L10 [Candidatus Magasanikbacteria bacterium]